MPQDKRPPKGWWDRCVRSVGDQATDPQRLCGWLWYHHMGRGTKRKIAPKRAQEEANPDYEEVIGVIQELYGLTREEAEKLYNVIPDFEEETGPTSGRPPAPPSDAQATERSAAALPDLHWGAQITSVKAA